MADLLAGGTMALLTSFVAIHAWTVLAAPGRDRLP